jgi:hypothetical protein
MTKTMLSRTLQLLTTTTMEKTDPVDVLEVVIHLPHLPFQAMKSPIPVVWILQQAILPTTRLKRNLTTALALQRE